MKHEKSLVADQFTEVNQNELDSIQGGAYGYLIALGVVATWYILEGTGATD